MAESLVAEADLKSTLLYNPIRYIHVKPCIISSRTSTDLVVEWFSIRYQAAEKFSLVKSALIPGNRISKSFWGNLLLREKKGLKYT